MLQPPPRTHAHLPLPAPEAPHHAAAHALPACLQVKQFYTAPTLIRSLMRFGDDYVARCDRSSLRILGSVGEPINPEAWRWYHDVSVLDAPQCKPLVAFSLSGL